MSTWWQVLTRKKRFDSNSLGESQLARVLNTFDLTALGVGSTLGVGVYVLAGHVARDLAGPSVIISFLIAVITSVFAGLCYAEFGARVPRAGSAYIYSYVCVGEFIAFIIGWNLILEYVIGSASVARGMSLYLDTILNDTLKNTFREIAPITTPFMSEYFDFFSFGITVLLGSSLAFGLKESKWGNNIFTLINLLVVLFVIIAGAFNADISNWSIKPDAANSKYIGKGGFFPFGVWGTIKGAATCFYGFVGFDCIATTGEEVKNPKKAIPTSIILSLFIIFLAYFGTSAVVTLMVPYYEQDVNAPIPYAFGKMGWITTKWIVAIGGMFGLCASLFGAMFPLPRIIYAMASDALIFRFLGTVNQKFHTPVVGTIVVAVLTGLMSALFELKQLVNMMSIGTLMAYTIVATCVLLLRYSIDEDGLVRYSLLQYETDSEYEYSDNPDATLNGEYSTLLTPDGKIFKGCIKQVFNWKKQTPNRLTQRIVSVQVFIFCILSVLLGCCLRFFKDDLSNGTPWIIILTGVTVSLMLLVLISISLQPTSTKELSFKVPLVPLIPAFSICINIYLMFMLDANTWIRFGIWMIIGLPIYFASVKLYKNRSILNAGPDKKKSAGMSFTIQNGTINRAYIEEEYAEEFTIPKIVVEPATPMEPDKGYQFAQVTQQSETNNNDIINTEINRQSDRKTVFDRRSTMELVDEAVAELEKILETETEKFLEPLAETEITTATRDCSNSHESTPRCSVTHQVQAEIHREDEIEDDTHKENVSETIEKYNDEQPKDFQEEVYKEKENIKKGNEHMETINDVIKSHYIEEIEDRLIIMDSEKAIDNSTNTEEDTTSEEQQMPLIPPPPPLPPPIVDFPSFQKPSSVKSPGDVPIPTPQKKRKAPDLPKLVTSENLKEVKLKLNRTLPRMKKISDINENLTENVKSGTKEHSKIKEKLNNMLKNFQPLTNPLYLAPVDKEVISTDDNTPEITKSEELLSPEIPDNFARTDQFKDQLKQILKSHSLRKEKPQKYMKHNGVNNKNNYNNQEQPNEDNDKDNHKKQMLGTLRSIKLRKTGMIDFDDNNDDANKVDEMEQHKRKMAGSLKEIKLRKIGKIDITDTDDEAEDEQNNIKTEQTKDDSDITIIMTDRSNTNENGNTTNR